MWRWPEGPEGQWWSSPFMGRWPEGPEGQWWSSPFMGRWPEGPEGQWLTYLRSIEHSPWSAHRAGRRTAYIRARGDDPAPRPWRHGGGHHDHRRRSPRAGLGVPR